MGSQNRSCMSEIDGSVLGPTNGPTLVEPACVPVLESDAKIDGLEPNLTPADDATLLPIPPRLKEWHGPGARFAVQVLDLDGPETPPPVPRRSIVRQNLKQTSPSTANRPLLEPRQKCKTPPPLLANVHTHSRLLTPRTKFNISRLRNSEAEPEPLVICRVPASEPALHVNSRIILDRGRPTTVVVDTSFDAENLRASPGGRVIQLSVWPGRSASSNPHLDSVVHSLRRTNDYVDSPTLGRSSNATTNRSVSPSPPQVPRVSNENALAQVHGQRAGTNSKGDGQKKSETADVSAKRDDVCKDPIICSQCGRCRCRKCVEPRHESPRCRIGRQECSIDSMVDHCTCMSCARAIFNRCSPAAAAECADDPCAGLEQPRCCSRWTAMGLLSICLPCLCCYWPMRCAARACTSCCDGCHRVYGCQCRQDVPAGSKRLLAESESSSF